jgi:hypothetical protein
MINSNDIRYTEANVQHKLQQALLDRGFDARVECNPKGQRNRFDICVFDIKDRLRAVVEVKNANCSLADALEAERKMLEGRQGQKYKEEARKHGFKFFACGGIHRVEPCANEVSRYFKWRRLLSIFRIGVWC